jgi:hypothetical protein
MSLILPEEIWGLILYEAYECPIKSWQIRLVCKSWDFMIRRKIHNNKYDQQLDDYLRSFKSSKEVDAVRKLFKIGGKNAHVEQLMHLLNNYPDYEFYMFYGLNDTYKILLRKDLLETVPNATGLEKDFIKYFARWVKRVSKSYKNYRKGINLTIQLGNPDFMITLDIEKDEITFINYNLGDERKYILTENTSRKFIKFITGKRKSLKKYNEITFGFLGEFFHGIWTFYIL